LEYAKRHRAEYPAGGLELKSCASASDWSDRGAILCFGQPGVFAVSADDGDHPQKLAEGGLWYPQISPDGKRVAYMTQQSGKFQVVLASFPAFADRRQISAGEEAIFPQWRSDGRELYYAANDKIMSVDVRPGDSIETGTPKVLFKASMLRTPWRKFAAASDGSRFLLIEPIQSGAVRPINAVVNWSALLDRPR
jgi:hypothetical protein